LRADQAWATVAAKASIKAQRTLPGIVIAAEFPEQLSLDIIEIHIGIIGFPRCNDSAPTQIPIDRLLIMQPVRETF